jgi:PIN domain nuclease of toxin-antitoxin system
VNRVLDASALIAYLQNEPGGADVDAILASPESASYAHVLNLCEVYYHFVRTAGQTTALSVMSDLEAAGVIARDDLDTSFWQAVGDLKAGGGISLPDCFCVLLAQRLSAEAVTADRAEFTRIVSLGLCPINFIR